MIDHKKIIKSIEDKSLKVGILGLGYVGLPLLLEFAKKDFPVMGYDKDQSKIDSLEKGKSYIRHIDSQHIIQCNEKGKTLFTSDESKISEMDVILICVPTPLTPQREPDMSFVEGSCRLISKYLRDGQVVVLESTTYPGTTEELMSPILEKSGLKANRDFILGYSPEREDPNNKDFSTSTIPKVAGCDCDQGLEIVIKIYENVVTKVVPVSSTKAAEATKLLENIYRSVNIALVNELKILFTEMDIDVWEVIDAAATKPFGFHPFYPGPGLGGHCIPIDPFYLTWKAREYNLSTRFIELAGEINTFMPGYVVQIIQDALNSVSKSMKNSKILIMGIAYKKDVDDMRESPSLEIMELLENKGALIAYHDPYVLEVPHTREHDNYSGMKSVSINDLGEYDAVIISTDHSSLNYEFIFNNSKLIIDTRNVYPLDKYNSSKLFKA